MLQRLDLTADFHLALHSNCYKNDSIATSREESYTWWKLNPAGFCLLDSHKLVTLVYNILISEWGVYKWNETLLFYLYTIHVSKGKGVAVFSGQIEY